MAETTPATPAAPSTPTTSVKPKLVNCEVIGDTPVDGVYKGGTVSLHPEVAKSWAELKLVKEVA